MGRFVNASCTLQEAKTRRNGGGLSAANPSDFAGQLCVALNHRWEASGYFMFAYTAYLDESGTHDGSEITVMGGVLGRADQWKRFQSWVQRRKAKIWIQDLPHEEIQKQDWGFQRVAK
jgi:hypothetical protein